MEEQIVINQHYIPQCLLKYFANDKEQVFEALVEAKRVYPTNYRNSMSKRFTYEHPELETNKVEKYFDKIESYFGPAVQGIIDTIEKFEANESDFLEVKEAVFRNMQDFIKFYYRSGALLTEFEFERTTKYDKVLMMLDKILNSNYLKELSRTVTSYYNFAIIKSDKREFVLSDQYVSTVALTIKNRFFNASNRSMGMTGLMILIPLSGKFYAVLYDRNVPSYISSNRINSLDQEQVDEINEVIINNSYTKCISNNQESLKRAITKFDYKSPSATYAGGSGTYYGATLKKEVFFYQNDREAWDLFISNAWLIYRELERNDPCACGSGKKYKMCCLDKAEICKRMYSDIEHEQTYYQVHDGIVGEKSIDEFYGKE